MDNKDDDKLSQAAETQKHRMMKFDVQPARNTKEEKVIKKAGRRWTPESKDLN